MRPAAILSLLALLGWGADRPPAIEVTASGGVISLAADGAPLSDVLDRVSAVSGMKVVYDGPQPRQRVSVAIRAGSWSEAVYRLLEGQALNYAVALDASEARVETLVIVNSRGAAEAPRPAVPAMPPEYVLPDPDAENVPEPEGPIAEPPRAPVPPPGFAGPPPGYPGQGPGYPNQPPGYPVFPTAPSTPEL